MRKAVLFLGLALAPGIASAYFDPGTGSLLIQALVGALAAVTVFWSNLKAYVRRLFSGRKRPSAGSPDDPAPTRHDPGRD